MPSSKYLTAAQVAAALGISRSSVYAYVSRGRVRAYPHPSDSRASVYSATDVDTLRRRKEARRNPEVAAKQNLAWGMPVLESGITLIRDGRLYYRGLDVVNLAEHATFEEVAHLLWHDNDSEPIRFPACRRFNTAETRPTTPIARMQSMLPLIAARDRHAFDTSRPAVTNAGRRIVAGLAIGAAPARNQQGLVAARLARAWRREHPYVERALNLVLTVCADHELNASTFAVRVVSSAGGSPYDAVAAGLAALRGYRHGGDTERVENLLDEVRRPASFVRLLVKRTLQGTGTPGFGHPLYPDGDPRAAAMLNLLTTYWTDTTAAALAAALHAQRMQQPIDYPNLDFGLVLLRRALGLPRGAALALFALGRSAGWIAHALEQYETAQLIRPRALYAGPRPID
ncbi:MAG TPA: citrate synthase family protein [Vicinamibacterales bacterium]|jgi:citrate synthase|nr:citrate synthase family protein [Vicinamibacterales bacterium]